MPTNAETALDRIIYNYYLHEVSSIAKRIFEIDLTFIEPLIKRDAGMKIVDTYENGVYGKCPVCENTCHDSMNFCPKCGQRLEWK